MRRVKQTKHFGVIIHEYSKTSTRYVAAPSMANVVLHKLRETMHCGEPRAVLPLQAVIRNMQHKPEGKFSVEIVITFKKILYLPIWHFSNPGSFIVFSASIVSLYIE